VHRYQILVAGELPEAAREEFGAWAIAPVGADTAVTGDMDQAALHGVFARIRRLGLRIVEVRRLRPVPGAAADDGRERTAGPAPP
jgi:hypothetical protein